MLLQNPNQVRNILKKELSLHLHQMLFPIGIQYEVRNVL